MRTNLEQSRITAARNFASRFGAMSMNLNDVFVIPPMQIESPVVYNLAPLGGNKIVKLPALVEERFIVIANVGPNVLDVQDASGLLLVSIPNKAVGMFFGGSTEWRWLLGTTSVVGIDFTGITEQLRIVTAAGPQVVGSTEAGLVIAKAVASPTPVQLPAVATRTGKPVRLVDWGGNSEITITPAAGEKIMNLSSWVIGAAGGGGTMLFPVPGLSGWTVGA